MTLPIGGELAFSGPANGRNSEGPELHGWSFGEPGVSDVPVTAVKGLWESQGFFFVLLVDWEDGFGKSVFSFQESV